jgi:hypothetical protein
MASGRGSWLYSPERFDASLLGDLWPWGWRALPLVCPGSSSAQGLTQVAARPSFPCRSSPFANRVSVTARFASSRCSCLMPPARCCGCCSLIEKGTSAPAALPAPRGGPGIGTPHVGTSAGRQCIQCSSAPRTEVLCQSQRPRIRSNRLADLLALSRSASPAAFLVHRLPGLTNTHRSASTTPELAKPNQSSSPCLASERPHPPHTHGNRKQATSSHERLEAPITER